MLFFLIVLLSSCKEYVPYEIGEQGAESTFLALMNEVLDESHHNAPGIGMSVRCDDKNLNWSGVVGFDSKDKSQKLELDQPFRIASITKTFVAAAILRLHEMERVSIEEPISKYISQEHQSILSNGGYDLDKITIHHCLNHTSGLFDYAMGGSPYGSTIKENPKRRWSRTDQLKYAVEHGRKLGYPGEKYAYSDTGYILLGEVIEYFYENDLAFGLRELLGFEKLGMQHTWLETLEEEPKNMKRPVRRYFQGQDATKFDASVDLYGGGGLVSSVGDLNLFFNGLFNHKIFDQASTLDLMLTKPKYDASYDTKADRRYKDYRLGLWEVKINNLDVYMHSGLWGTHLLHQVESNTTVAINFTYGGSDRLIKKTFMAVHSIEKED